MSNIYPIHRYKAQEIIDNYGGEVPLHIYLKQFFKEYPKAGSKDRKAIGSLVYGYYRAGRIFTSTDIDERIRWLEEKHTLEELQELFWFAPLMSEKVNQEVFLKNCLVPQRVFFRAYLTDFQRSEILKSNHITEHKPNVFSCPNQFNLQQLMEEIGIANPQWVIQDISSASTIEMVDQQRNSIAWWDACCGAGGKSLLWYKSLKNIQITATDVRSSILKNYAERMKLYGFKSNAYEWDVYQQIHQETFEGIILDVPCSGSGTWARTPEEHCFFDPSQLKFYTKLQKQLLNNAIQSLNNDGQLIYITCSVLTEENESIMAYAEAKLGLKIEDQSYFSNAHLAGDTLFAARLAWAK